MTIAATDIKDIGTRVRELRVSRGLTQAELASRVGTRQPVIARLEAGQHVPMWRTLDRVAEALGVTVSVDLVEPA